MLIVVIENYFNYKGCDFIENIKYLFDAVLSIFNCNITVWGYTFSFFNVFVLSMLISIVSYVVYRAFND